MARTKQTARKFKGGVAEGTFGYSCTLYKDFLIFFGGTYDREPINQASVYNLKEERMEENRYRGGIMRIDEKFGHAACYYERGNMIIFYGGEPTDGGFEHNPALVLEETRGLYGEDGLSWNIKHGISGPAMESPVAHIYNNKLFMYQSNVENGCFGLLRVHDFNRGDWQQVYSPSNGMDLPNYPNQAIFAQNKLYVFTMESSFGPRATTFGGHFIEEVYAFNLDDEEENGWKKIPSSEKKPGILSNISMAEAGGIIYMFGTCHNDEVKGKPVLWTFDTNQEEWRLVEDIGDLTARPNQRAVIYKGQLMIIDWDYLTKTIGIQYYSLNGLAAENTITQSPSGKDICKDQADSFLQEFKTLYENRLFPDVVFQVEGEEIPAHKALLAYRSDFFMKLFTSGGGGESQDGGKIPISNMKPHIFKAILQYVYCNEVELDEQLALDLIPVIDEYLMKGLKGLCEKYLCKQLRKENVVDMLIVADKHQISELKKACFKYIVKNLGSLDENEEMMKLSKLLFIELLKFNTPGLQQKGNAKSEKKEYEESKSNNLFGYAQKTSAVKQATSFATPAYGGFGGGYGATTSTTGLSFGTTYAAPTRATIKLATRAASRSKSRSRSPQLRVSPKKAEK